MSEWFAPEATRYPERPDPGVGWRQRLERRLMSWPARYRYLLIRRELAGLGESKEARNVSVETLRISLRRDGITTGPISLWYAFERERGAGDDALAGALALIRGMAVQCDKEPLQAEMVALASKVIALSGLAVHVLTPDDNRSQELTHVMQSHLQPCGLCPAVIESDTPPPQRCMAYQARVTIVSARQALRDYLDDRLQLRQQGEIARKLGRLVGQNPLHFARMRGLPFGIIVDADQVLIDQACEPLVIAGRTAPDKESAWAETALALARLLEEGVHYTAGTDHDIALTEEGNLQLDQSSLDLPGIWRNKHRRNNDILLALKALRLEQGQHYRVVDQRLELPSDTSMPDGMLQLLEMLEGITVTGRAVARAKLTYQRFFRRYKMLSAICSETRYIRDELWQIYGLSNFEVTSAKATPESDRDLLGLRERRFVDAVYGINKYLGKLCGMTLTNWHVSRRRKAAERVRRKLLKLDNQIDSFTAFSGRTE